MRIPFLFLTAAVTLAAQSPSTALAQPASPVGQVFPDAFQGRWAANTEVCAEEWDESRLVVTRYELQFYESSGKARSITRSGENEVVALLDFEGEGETWSDTLRLTLSPDAKMLVDHQPDGAEVTRIRCAALKGKT